MTRTGQVIPISAAVFARASASGLELDPASVSESDLAAWRRRQVVDDARRHAISAEVRLRPEALLDAGFPRRAVEHALAANELNPVVARLRAWDPCDRCVILVSGSRGTGKTVAAAWWALRRRSAPAFVRAAEFARTSRYERGDHESPDEGRSRLLAAPALVLDDLGAEFADSRGSFLVDLDELVDVYHADKRPLVITTNVPVCAFAARYGERIADRIRESGVCFETPGASLRGAP